MRHSDLRKLTQDEINEAEWNNPENWNMFLYSSRYDTRIVVPQRSTYGVSLNFDHAAAYWIVFGYLALPLALIGIIMWAYN
jgi:uncharacterized membrane protein